MKKKSTIFIIISLCMVAGCDNLRFAPSQSMKSNAWLHQKTTKMAADIAEEENVSEQLQQLAAISHLQSQPFVGYFGLPEKIPSAATFEQIVSESSNAITEKAFAESIKRPGFLDITDAVINVALAVTAVFGGVYGAKFAGFLKMAKNKTLALREIIEGNELFKMRFPEQAENFKDSQYLQSPETRKMVSEMKTI